MHPILDSSHNSLVERERNRLRLLLGNLDKYTVAYLGGGDFLVHAAGLDPDIDRCVHEIPQEPDPVN